MSARLLAARLRLEKAKRHADKVLASEYPVGSFVRWERGGHIQNGYVVLCGTHQNLRVRNAATGRVYWIDAYFLVKVGGAENDRWQAEARASLAVPAPRTDSEGG